MFRYYDKEFFCSCLFKWFVKTNFGSSFFLIRKITYGLHLCIWAGLSTVCAETKLHKLIDANQTDNNNNNNNNNDRLTAFDPGQPG